MHAFIIAAVMSVHQPSDTKVCKVDRVRSPVKAASIPRIRCVLAKKHQHLEDDTHLARTFDYSVSQE